MNITLIVLIILLSIIIVICIKNIKEQNQIIDKIRSAKNEELKNIFKESWDNEERKFDLKRANLLTQEEEIENKIAQLNVIFSEKENQYKAINQDLDFYRDGKIEEIDRATAEYKKRKLLLTDAELIDYTKSKTKEINNYLNTLEEKQKKKEYEIKQIQEELEVERSKRAAINEEILRQRQMEEEGDFYRIQLNPNDKNDVLILRDIAPRLRHPEAINKVIWSGYYQKPLADLRKRLLPNGDVSGVYKITRLKTKEIYIGQSTSIDRRFQDHVKTALGVGTLANSRFHKVLFEDGPENFFFEVLEETDKTKLRERESYYIDWFKSDRFGLNTIKGDQNK